jgi:hypothetical protein
MGRRLLRLARWTSLLVCLFTLATWHRTRRSPEHVRWGTAEVESGTTKWMRVRSGEGRVLIMSDHLRVFGRVEPERVRAALPHGEHARWEPAAPDEKLPDRAGPEAWRRRGFGYRWDVRVDGSGPQVVRHRVLVVAFPHWVVIAVTAAPTVPVLVGSIRRRRWLRRGKCGRCGYDLRESPARCPECGTPAEELRSGRRRPRWVIIGSALAAVAIGCLIWWAAGGRRAEIPDRPRWWSLGGHVYRASEVDPAASGILRFDELPHWFGTYAIEATATEQAALEFRMLDDAWAWRQVGLPWPGLPLIAPLPLPPEEVPPAHDDGTTLSLRLEPPADEPGVIRATVTLRAGTHEVLREVEHRHTNVLPLLFHVEVDGKVATRGRSGGYTRMGGANHMVRLLGPGESRTWELRIAESSVREWLGDGGDARRPRAVRVVAAFAERQHEYQSALSRPMPVTRPSPRPVLVRSAPATLSWDGENWVAAHR